MQIQVPENFFRKLLEYVSTDFFVEKIGEETFEIHCKQHGVIETFYQNIQLGETAIMAIIGRHLDESHKGQQWSAGKSPVNK